MSTAEQLVVSSVQSLRGVFNAYSLGSSHARFPAIRYLCSCRALGRGSCYRRLVHTLGLRCRYYPRDAVVRSQRLPAGPPAVAAAPTSAAPASETATSSSGSTGGRAAYVGVCARVFCTVYGDDGRNAQW